MIATKRPDIKETDLYAPVKRYLEKRGYTVKGEVANCDVVALRHGESPVVVELKRTLTLGVILQAVARSNVSSTIYVGVPRGCPALRRSQRKNVTRLFKMLGMGLMTISHRARRGAIEVLLDPGVYKPRVSTRRVRRLLGEFESRVGDTTPGGTDRRRGILTAYRQRALRIAQMLEANGPTKASKVAAELDDPKARALMYRDVYGWFDKRGGGVYALTAQGRREMKQWIGSGG